jgi:hypothetical protein
MSKVPTWVLAVDGRVYQDPVLEGPDWFLCFDDDEPPELVIALLRTVPKGGSWRWIEERTREIMEGLKIVWHFYGSGSRVRFGHRCFGEGVSNMKHAGAVFLKLESAIPIPQRFAKKSTILEAVRSGESFWLVFDRAQELNDAIRTVNRENFQKALCKTLSKKEED